MRIETPHQVMGATRLVESVRATKNELAKPHPNPALLSLLGIGGGPPTRDALTTREWQTLGIGTGLGTIGGLSVALILEATGLRAIGVVLGGTALGGFVGARLIRGNIHGEPKIPGWDVGGNLQFGLPDPVPPREPPTNATSATGEDIVRKLLAEICDLNRHADAHATDQRAKAPGVSADSSMASLLSQFDNVETRRLLQEKAYRADPATLLPLLHLDEATQLLSIPGLLAYRQPILPNR